MPHHHPGVIHRPHDSLDADSENWLGCVGFSLLCPHGISTAPMGRASCAQVARGSTPFRETRASPGMPSTSGCSFTHLLGTEWAPKFLRMLISLRLWPSAALFVGPESILDGLLGKETSGKQDVWCVGLGGHSRNSMRGGYGGCWTRPAEQREVVGVMRE